MKPKIKVCGMRLAENIQDIAALPIDYLGFIFYEKSSRFVGENFDEKIVKSIPETIQKVGVFVNATEKYVLEKSKKYALDLVQLHGSESPKFCESMKKNGLKVIKVCSVGDNFDFEMLKSYQKYSDFFLFDTKGEKRGGNGITFDWSLLKKYDNEIPIFLSGGLSLGNLAELENLKGVNIHALDVNSKFEIAPAFKDVEKIKSLTNYFKDRN